MARRSEKRERAKALYVARKGAGRRVNLRELAAELEVPYQSLRNWKSADGWDQALPRKKRGGQPGNQNSRGKKNAAGPHPGAPTGNKNAEKDGAYSAVLLDMLTDQEREVADAAPLESREALEHEMRVLKVRENRILTAIARYEKEPEETLHLSSAMAMTGEKEMVLESKDTAFSRGLKLQEALHKVQGRIVRVADSLRALEENLRREDLERERLEILRMRATGAVEVELPEGEAPE